MVRLPLETGVNLTPDQIIMLAAGTGRQGSRSIAPAEMMERHRFGPSTSDGIWEAPVMDCYEFSAELWIWDARKEDGWTFLSVPPEESEEIRA